MTEPAADLSTFLAANVAGLTSGTNLFVSKRRPVSNNFPRSAVFLSGVPGLPVTRVMGDVENVRYAVVETELRWVTYAGGDSKIREIQDALQGPTIAGYLDVAVLESEPIPLGADDEGNHLFALNVQMVYGN